MTGNNEILRALDKLDRIGEAGVYELLTAGRRDKSGDFTSGCGLSALHALDIICAISPRIAKRFKILELLVASDAGGGRTGLDVFYDMCSAPPIRKDIALDQIVEGIEARFRSAGQSVVGWTA